jgi:hypothetical protein
MSKRHHATRRRAYGRRQHELHQRGDVGWQADLAEVQDEPREPTGRPDKWRGPDRLGAGLELGLRD